MYSSAILCESSTVTPFSSVSRDVVGDADMENRCRFRCLCGPFVRLSEWPMYVRRSFQGIGVFGAEYLAGRLMGLDPLQTVIPWTLGEESLF